MKARDLSDNELARRLTEPKRTVYPSSVGAWKRGVVPDGKNLFLLPKVLEVTADWLLLGEGPMERPPKDALVSAYDSIARIMDALRRGEMPPELFD